MARVTSKLQVTIPKRVAVQYGIGPGDDIEFLPAGDAIRVRPARGPLDPTRRLELFDGATSRQEARRDAGRESEPGDRGWRRDELYERGRAG